MDTARTVYSVSAERPGSEVAAETAAALAAASMVLRDDDPYYSRKLLENGMRAFEFADTYKGAYSDDPGLKAGVCPFYCDFDGYQASESSLFIHLLRFLPAKEGFRIDKRNWYEEAYYRSYYNQRPSFGQDELLWGAAWLRRASQNDSFLSYIQNNGKTLGADDNINEFGWDNKHAGLNVLVSKEFMEGQVLSLESYKEFADSFMCTLMPESSSSHIQYTPGGLLYKPGGSNMQHVTSISFLLLTYAKYLAKSSQTVNCGSIQVGPASLQLQAKKQVQ
ncbi:hypothetical protein GW17_00023896 [Ensete ventricosum]|nr:hypothetical protein GW17_00023896 [Ensete ventricosum]RZS18287.1 hypothetical protein BHM03_00050530 [Ensete ventricosum]